MRVPRQSRLRSARSGKRCAAVSTNRRPWRRTKARSSAARGPLTAHGHKRRLRTRRRRARAARATRASTASLMRPSCQCRSHCERATRSARAPLDGLEQRRTVREVDGTPVVRIDEAQIHSLRPLEDVGHARRRELERELHQALRMPAAHAARERRNCARNTRDASAESRAPRPHLEGLVGRAHVVCARASRTDFMARERRANARGSLVGRAHRKVRRPAPSNV